MNDSARPEVREVKIGDVPFGGGRPFALIAGPCVIEDRDHILRHAEAVARIARERGIPVVFKSSYDKANRSSDQSFRGVGIDEGLALLDEARREQGVPLLTDVHTEEQARAAGEVVDCLQVPAFLSRQTDLLQTCGRTGKAVNVKKGQFLAPEDMQNIVDKLAAVGCTDTLLTERGTSFGYRTLVVDFAGFSTMRATGQPLIFDATHSVQRPGGQGTTSGGDRTKVPYLARAAVACGIDGLFLEVHENPDAAPSDGPNMVPLSQLGGLLDELRRVADAVGGADARA